MSGTDPLRPGELVEWVGARYDEQDVGSVRPGARGTFVSIDGDAESDGVVVSFEPVGAFCCRREDVRRAAR